MLTVNNQFNTTTKNTSPSFGAVNAFSKLTVYCKTGYHKGYMDLNGKDVFVKPKIGNKQIVSILEKLDEQLNGFYFLKNIFKDGPPLVKYGTAGLELSLNKKKNPVLKLTSSMRPDDMEANEEIIFEQTSKGKTKADKLFESIVDKYNKKLSEKKDN